MNLAEHSWTDARDAETDLALVPVGSTEQHGPHAPLGVDHMTAEAIAEEAAERYAAEHDDEPVVAPAIPVGVAEEHRAFDGTLWVTEDTFRSYVADICRSLAHHGFDRVVVVNGHGGNTGALREVCGRLTRDGDCYAVPFTWFDVVAPEFELGHGGPTETSLMLHLAPDLVREERYAEAAEGAGHEFGVFVDGTNLAYDFDEFSESGNLADPTPATAAEGERLLASSADACVRVLAAIEEREWTGERERSDD
ncbi:creatininase family protein [Haloglomus halophilum]|uniref:creatininase family protein n=1 Tax=Haloglomus halophilum TaxID=2962672 RepID=UPI0020C9A78C|nr:creatininase family protein [Haloglomus halophilum]